MCTLRAVEPVLDGVLLGFFVGSIGVGVGDLGRLAGGAYDNGMPLGNETTQGKDGKDVAGDGCLSVRGMWKREGTVDLPMFRSEGDGSHIGIGWFELDGLMSEDGFDVIM